MRKQTCILGKKPSQHKRQEMAAEISEAVSATQAVSETAPLNSDTIDAAVCE